jgi:hypothetical protein
LEGPLSYENIFKFVRMDIEELLVDRLQAKVTFALASPYFMIVDRHPVLMPIRIRFSILMPIRIKIPPQVYTC